MEMLGSRIDSRRGKQQAVRGFVQMPNTAAA
jgi:hypothetical protein